MMIQSPSASLVVTSRTEAAVESLLGSKPVYCRLRSIRGDRKQQFETVRGLVLRNRIFERTAMGVLIRVTWMPETMPGRLYHLLEKGRLYIMTTGIY